MLTWYKIQKLCWMKLMTRLSYKTVNTSLRKFKGYSHTYVVDGSVDVVDGSVDVVDGSVDVVDGSVDVVDGSVDVLDETEDEVVLRKC